MFTMNPDAPNPSLLNLLLHGVFLTFDGGCYLRRVETEDGFYVEAGIGLSPYRMRFDLAEGELCLRKVAEWFAAKRVELLKNIPSNVAGKGGKAIASAERETRFVCQNCHKTYRFGDAVNDFSGVGDAIKTLSLCFCSNTCQSLYKTATGRNFPPVGAEIPLSERESEIQNVQGMKADLGLMTPLDETMLKEIESGRIKYRDAAIDGPVYHGQVATEFQRTDNTDVEERKE